MRPPKEELVLFQDDRKAAAKHFDVSERTVSRWMQHYGIYKPKANYGCGKLSRGRAKDIRVKHQEGMMMKDLAEEYGVTVAAISRIVHNINYKEVKETAHVSVIYNHISTSGAYIG